MIRKFRNFDAEEFVSKKKALKEAAEAALEPEKQTMKIPETDPNIPEEEVIIGTPVYEDPYLLKISNIVSKRLKNIGDFGIGYNIVYLNNVPGVRFFAKDGSKHIVCCRDKNGKSISIFDEFEPGKENIATVTYSTKKLGFKDMLDQLVYDLQNNGPIEEGFSGRIGAGFTEKNVKRFERLPEDEKQYVYDFIRTYGEKQAVEQFFLLIQDKDTMATKVLQAFIDGPLASKDGQSRYLMSCAATVVSLATGGRVATSVQKAVDAGVFDNLVKSYKGEGPAIATSAGIAYEVSDAEEELEKKMKAREDLMKAKIEEDTENYESTITELELVIRAMCNYVHQNGDLDNNDKSIMSRRGVLLTGKGGIGKTHTLKKILKEKNMVLNRDYVWAGSGCSTADSVYQLMYEYNGKMLVFDDSPNLFDGDYRISMWKNALQTDIEDCLIGFPGKESKLKVYNVRRLKGDRQKQYYTEIGRKSADDKTDFYKKEMKKYSLYYSSTAPGGVASKEDADQEMIDLYMTKIDDAWKDEEENTQPSMPNEFIFRGLVVIISNSERDTFVNEVGKGNWDAISSRFENYDIAPLAESIWTVMKKKILTEYADKTIPDDKCAIPRDMVEEFIEEVEKLLADPNYQSINWRTLSMFHDVLNGSEGREFWKKKLKRELSRK